MKDKNSAEQLKNAIATKYSKPSSLGKCNAACVIASVLVSEGVSQSRERISGGWVCGYYTNRIRQRIQAELKAQYSAAVLEDLAEYCSQDELIPEQEALLNEITQKIPRVYINGL